MQILQLYGIVMNRISESNYYFRLQNLNNLVMRYCAIFTSILFMTNVIGQTSLEWGEPEEAPYTISVESPLIIGSGIDSYLIKSNKYNTLNFTYDLRTGFSSKTRKNVMHEFQDVINPCNYIFIGDQLVHFETVKTEGNLEYYAVKQTDDLISIGNSLKLGTAEFNKDKLNSQLSVVQSNDRKFVLAYWVINDSEVDRKPTFGYSVINENLEIVRTGQIELPMVTNYAHVNKISLSNYGDIYLVVTEYGIPKGVSRFGVFRDERLHRIYRTDSDRTYILKVENDKNSIMEIELDNKLVQDISLNSDGGSNLSVLVTYVEKTSLRRGYDFSQGLAFITFSFEDVEHVRVEYLAFSNELIMNNISLDDQISKNELKDQHALKNISLNNFFWLDNGSVIGSFEQHTLAAEWGESDYISRNIFAFKVDSTGKFRWLTEIEKRQSCLSTGFAKTSYSSVLVKNTIHFIFNDVLTNYNLEGDYVSSEVIDWIRIGKSNEQKNQVLAIASIELEEGQISERKILYTDPEKEFLAMPKSFFKDVDGNLIMYAADWSNSKVRFGTLRW